MKQFYFFQASMTEEHDNYSIFAAASAVLGGFIFVFNFSIFYFIAKVALTGNRTDKNDFIVHILFVSINDTLCGLVVFLIGLVRIQDKTSAYMCAVFIFLSLSLQIVSQGNIACICVQRYVTSKYIRNTQAKWQSIHTKILIIVNLFIGMLSFSLSMFLADFDAIPISSMTCKLKSVMTEEVGKHITVNVSLGIVITLIADIFCVLTCCQLKTHMQTVGSSNSQTQASASVATETDTDGHAHHSLRARHRRALWTIFLIVTFFNLSVLPICVGFILVLLKVEVSEIIRRSLILSLFINSSINPVIIATRTHAIKVSIKDFIYRVSACVQNCFAMLKK